MELKGKKVVFLGDSITEGIGASCVEKSYPNVFAKLSGANVVIDGIGGTRIARQTRPSANPRVDLDFNQRALLLDKDADVIVVFGGTNDFGHGDARIGEMTDRTYYTFYGALHKLYDYLLSTYPRSTIVVMTPMHRINEDDTANEYGLVCKPLKDYVAIIKEVAEFYSLPVLDLWKSSGLQPKVRVINETYFADGLHPSDAGAEKIANLLYNYLKVL